MKMTYLSLAYEVLKSANAPMEMYEIWEVAQDLGLDKRLKSIGKTPTATLGALMYVDIRDKADSKFMQVSSRPSTFWLRARESELKALDSNIESNSVESNSAESSISHKSHNAPESSDRGFNERDLHPLLVKYLHDSNDFGGLFCKTIYHEKTPKSTKGKDKWIHPDMVGVHFPFKDYTSHTLHLLKNIAKPSHKIYAFELKVRLDFSNLKESYFQAVSNSSFANEGYLVVFESIEKEVRAELERLNASFGIGVIQLDSEVLESEVILRSRFRELDIDTLDVLARKNSDFEEFILNLNEEIVIGKEDRINRKKYDKILENEELERYIKQKGIVKK